MDDTSIIIEDILSLIIKTLKKEKNDKKIKMYILKPTLDYIMAILKPYLILTCIIIVSILFLLISIVVVVMHK